MSRRQHCFNCGEDIGPWERGCQDPESCGKSECNRELQNTYAIERAEAHEQLDRDLGYY